MPNELDFIDFNFDANGVIYINIAVAFVMFGVAIGLTPDHFYKVLQQPRKVIVGLFSQLICLPLATVILITIIQPQASVALGMILVSVCPGGNVSNFMASVAKANVALSVCLTALTSVSAILLTPLGLSFWGSFYEPAKDIMVSIELNFLNVFLTILLIIIVPLSLGMYLRKVSPPFITRCQPILKTLSMVVFIIIVVAAVYPNLNIFLENLPSILSIVIVHNLLAYVTGACIAMLAGLDTADVKSIAIETGIQNSGLGLALIFAFFDGLGGMTFVAATWGIWHIISGLTISHALAHFSKRP